jgi:hypothetical protein
MAGLYGTFMGNEAGIQNTIAGNPAEFLIPGRARRTTQPKLPGEDPRAIESVYGSPNKIPVPVPGQNALPQAFMPGMNPMGNAGFYLGPQIGQQLPPGFLNKYVS